MEYKILSPYSFDFQVTNPFFVSYSKLHFLFLYPLFIPIGSYRDFPRLSPVNSSPLAMSSTQTPWTSASIWMAPKTTSLVITHHKLWACLSNSQLAYIRMSSVSTSNLTFPESNYTSFFSLSANFIKSENHNILSIKDGDNETQVLVGWLS